MTAGMSPLLGRYGARPVPFPDGEFVTGFRTHPDRRSAPTMAVPKQGASTPVALGAMSGIVR